MLVPISHPIIKSFQTGFAVNKHTHWLKGFVMNLLDNVLHPYLHAAAFRASHSASYTDYATTLGSLDFHETSCPPWNMTKPIHSPLSKTCQGTDSICNIRTCAKSSIQEGSHCTPIWNVCHIHFLLCSGGVVGFICMETFLEGSRKGTGICQSEPFHHLLDIGSLSHLDAIVS